jgi:hypothetical protein
MFMQDPTHPITTALVREFGIYPPGCYVRLVGGELGIVVQRGPTVTTPIVACLTTTRGAALGTPLRVDTSIRRYAILAVVGEGSVQHKLPLDRLVSTLN